MMVNKKNATTFTRGNDFFDPLVVSLLLNCNCLKPLKKCD